MAGLQEIITYFNAVHIMSDVELSEAIGELHELARQARPDVAQLCRKVSAALVAEMARRPSTNFEVSLGRGEPEVQDL